MSNENIVTVNVEALTALIANIVGQQLEQPLLYGNDHPFAQIVAEEVEGSPRIRDRIVSLCNEFASGKAFENAVIEAVEGSRSLERAVSSAIDYEDLASEISTSDLLAQISISEIADEISVSDVASEISMADLASEIDMETLAESIDYKALAKALIAELRPNA